MTSAIFKPASDGFSIRAAQVVDRHLGNSAIYAKWVDDSPARRALAPVDLLDTHPFPKIWLKKDTFGQGIATLFDPQINFATAPKTRLDDKPSTAYLLSLKYEEVFHLSVLLENTPSGKCVIYYRSKAILAIQEVSFPIFNRDLKELSDGGRLSIGREIAYNKYFGPSYNYGPYTITCISVPYPKPTNLPFKQPFLTRRDLEYSLKAFCLSALLLATCFKVHDIILGLYGYRLSRNDFIITFAPFSSFIIIAQIIYYNISHNQNSPYRPFLINKILD